MLREWGHKAACLALVQPTETRRGPETTGRALPPCQTEARHHAWPSPLPPRPFFFVPVAFSTHNRSAAAAPPRLHQVQRSSSMQDMPILQHPPSSADRTAPHVACARINPKSEDQTLSSRLPPFIFASRPDRLVAVGSLRLAQSLTAKHSFYLLQDASDLVRRLTFIA